MRVMRYGVSVIFLERSQKPVESGLFGISPRDIKTRQTRFQ